MSKQKYPQTASSTLSSTGTVSRKGREHYSHAKLDSKKDRRRREAFDRQDAYEKLTLTQQLATTDPVGSKKQRARILAAMERADAPQVKKAPLTSAEKGAKAVKRAQDAVAALPVTKQ